MPDEINGKLDFLIKSVGENSERLESIESLLVGDVKDSGRVGLLERIRIVEGWIAKREWFEKLIISVIVAQAIGIIFLLIQNALN